MPRCDPNLPSTWIKFRPSLCVGCQADCCALPVEVSTDDLVRLGLITADEGRGSIKRLARRLMHEGLVQAVRGKSRLFILQQTPTGDCLFLDETRRCTVYEKRPEVCRRFPTIGPRPGYCPERRQES